MKEKINTLIFDVWGVLFLPKDKKEKHLLSSFRELCLLINEQWIDTTQIQQRLSSIYNESSKWDINKEETTERMSKELNISSEETEKLFNTIYEQNTIENNELYDWILEVKSKRYKLGILSTQFHLSNDILIPKKYYKVFDAMEISCEDKIKKPDERAYISILKKLNVKPEECVFIDDKQENLDAAEKLGMHTILFTDNSSFISDLNRIIPINL